MRSPAASASPTPGASRRPTDAVSARDRRRRPNAARVNWGCGSIVAVPGQRASDRDVFIQRLPVQASAAEAACFPRFAGGTQKTREPGDGNPQRPPVRKLDPHVVLVEPDTHCPSRRIHSHAFSMRSRFASIYPVGCCATLLLSRQPRLTAVTLSARPPATFVAGGLFCASRRLADGRLPPFRCYSAVSRDFSPASSTAIPLFGG